MPSAFRVLACVHIQFFSNETFLQSSLINKHMKLMNHCLPLWNTMAAVMSGLSVCAEFWHQVSYCSKMCDTLGENTVSKVYTFDSEVEMWHTEAFYFSFRIPLSCLMKLRSSSEKHFCSCIWLTVLWPFKYFIYSVRFANSLHTSKLIKIKYLAFCEIFFFLLYMCMWTSRLAPSMTASPISVWINVWICDCWHVL